MGAYSSAYSSAYDIGAETIVSRAAWKALKDHLSAAGYAPNVMIGAPRKPPQHMTAAIIPAAGNIDELTLSHPRELHELTIRLYAQAEAEPEEDIEFKLDEMREKIEIDICGDFTLGGAIAYAEPAEFKWEYDYGEWSGQTYRTLDMTIVWRIDDRAPFAA